jgi:phospholipid-binding lipoprotein MlaA
MTRQIRLAPLLLCAALLAGCASAPSDPAARAQFKANNDPLEPLNRKVFAFNLVVDRVIWKPLAKGYRGALPPGGRDAVRHFLDNLNEPVVLANNLLQGRLADAGVTGCRFVVNSTVGVAGLADVAGRRHLPKQVGDFGQTLWSWGLPEGPYLILPVVGPSNPRDGIGGAVDAYLDPVRYIVANNNYSTDFPAGRIILDGIDKRSRNIESLDEMQREAIDYYASFRSLFRQHREGELRGPAAQAPVAAPGFYDDPGR